MPASASSSSISSGDSEEFGAVARSGFTRMYVLAYSGISPIDQSQDYESERANSSDEDDCDAKGSGHRRNAKQTEAPYYQLMYSTGRHYFHGPIDLPAGVAVDLGNDDDGVGAFDGVSAVSNSGVDLRELKTLLPHFRDNQDRLVIAGGIDSFRGELRDVFYQMEEVGEFVVEELAKPKVAARIEKGAREMHWMVAPGNPTFFELQTYPATNDSFRDAGVLLVVMKLVVRGVLLDIVYSRNSYFVTLRDNAEELALDDVFVPDVSCAGPCFEVRRYSDEDLKKLVLWCALPTENIGSIKSSLQQPSSKVLPLKASTTILEANDTQLYCLLADPKTERGRKGKGKVTTRLNHRGKDSENDDDDDDDDDVLCSTGVFQFNQYVYFGDARVLKSTLDDLAKLASIGFPYLHTQANNLAFFGEYDDLPHLWVNQDHAPDDGDASLGNFRSIHDRFREVASVLLEVVTDSQSWIANFLQEVRTVSQDAADATSASMPWLNAHLSRWLEADEGMESFFELELAHNKNGLVREWTEAANTLELLVWKGLVHQTLLLIIFRQGSFYVVLRPVSTEEGSVSRDDAPSIFGVLPPLFSKGRGYLVRKFPSTTCKDQEWLANAKLVLWQTSNSVDREAREEAVVKKRQSRITSSDWFETDDKEGDFKIATRGPEPIESKNAKELQSDAKDLPANKSKILGAKGDRVGKRHHLPSLDSSVRVGQPGAVAPPWDLRTGKPL